MVDALGYLEALLANANLKHCSIAAMGDGLRLSQAEELSVSEQQSFFNM